MKKTRFSFVSIENMSTFAAQTKKQTLQSECSAKKQTLQSECSAVGSALRSGRRGRAFESPHSDRRAADDSISFAALSYYSSIINNFVIILCGMRLFISLQMIG